MSEKIAIVLFSDDFRINDNSAFANASKDYDKIILLYVYNENYLGRPLGSASKVFLYHVLISFNKLLKKEYDIELTLRTGDVIEKIREILKTITVQGIYFNHSYTKEEIKKETLIKNVFKDLDVQSFKAKLIFDPWEIAKKSDEGNYKVYSPFSRECFTQIYALPKALPAPKSVLSPKLQNIKIDELNLLPKNERNWYIEMIKNWSFDYDEIRESFKNFTDSRLNKYTLDRNILSKNGSSRISAYLRFGVLSPRGCMQNIALAKSDSRSKFISELLWREFAYYTMFYNPEISTQELKPKYSNFKYDNSKELLIKWQKGKTGFDIVDAGMNELYSTGIMHNRARMITASFLIKDLLIDWRLGEQWFWDTLVDADPAVNPFSWQWVSGSGLDSSPSYRIFNPELQKQKFDNEGTYCRKWLPKTWKAEKIVDHAIQRKIALERYRALQ